MSFPETVFILNPAAGNGSTGANWPAIRALAEDRLGLFATRVTRGSGDARQMAADAIRRGADRIVCVGGDGTLNEVVNGIMEGDACRRETVRLGFVPNGTGCDFVRTVAIPADTRQAIEVIAAGRVRQLDVGRIFLSDAGGRRCCRYFHNVVSFGLGGDVCRRVNRTTKAFGPFCSFIWATLGSLFSYGKKTIRLKIDDQAEKEYVIWNAAVANGQYHGGGMRVAPDALADDGLFHITVIGDLSLPRVFANLPMLYNGRIASVRGVTCITGRKIIATSSQPVLLDVDGEQPGLLPATIDIVPGALKVITA